MNAFKKTYQQASKGIDWYTQFTYPIGVRAVAIPMNDEAREKKERTFILMDLMENFVALINKSKDIEMSQGLVRGISGLKTLRDRFHSKPNDDQRIEYADKYFAGAVGTIEGMTNEIISQHPEHKEFIVLHGVISNTLLNL